MATKKLAKKAGLAVFAKHMDDYKPADPYYEVYIDKKGREKRRRVSRAVGSNRTDADYLLGSTNSVIFRLDYQSETPRSSRVSTDGPITLTKASTFVVCALGGPSCSVRHYLRSPFLSDPSSTLMIYLQRSSQWLVTSPMLSSTTASSSARRCKPTFLPGFGARCSSITQSARDSRMYLRIYMPSTRQPILK